MIKSTERTIVPTKKQKKEKNTNKNNKRQNKAIKINPLKIGGPETKDKRKVGIIPHPSLTLMALTAKSA